MPTNPCLTQAIMLLDYGGPKNFLQVVPLGTHMLTLTAKAADWSGRTWGSRNTVAADRRDLCLHQVLLED